MPRLENVTPHGVAVPRLEVVGERHALTILDFELANRAYFARSIPDRGDGYFAQYAQRHANLLAEQESGCCRFHVLVDDDGRILGRFNLFDLNPAGGASLGYRVAEHAAGRGLAKLGVRELCAVARNSYGLDHLVASAALSNPASLAVLRATGFTPTGPVDLNGKPGLAHLLKLEHS